MAMKFDTNRTLRTKPSGACFPRRTPEKPGRESSQPRRPVRIPDGFGVLCIACRVARELRDRFLDEVNSGRLLPGGECQGKYDVSRQLEVGAGEIRDEGQRPLLEAA